MGSIHNTEFSTNVLVWAAQFSTRLTTNASNRCAMFVPADDKGKKRTASVGNVLRGLHPTYTNMAGRPLLAEESHDARGMRWQDYIADGLLIARIQGDVVRERHELCRRLESTITMSWIRSTTLGRRRIPSELIALTNYVDDPVDVDWRSIADILRIRAADVSAFYNCR